MKKGKSWGNSFNSARAARISEGVSNAIHSDIFFKEGLTEFGVMNVLLRELAGTYSFEEAEDWLMDLENTFWWNLMFYGRVGIFQYTPGEYIIVNVNNIVYSYQKISEVYITPASIIFEQQSSNIDPKQKKSWKLTGKHLDNIVVISNDVTSEFFQLKFGWFIHGILELNEMFWASTRMKMKKLAIWYNSKNEDVIQDLEESFNDGSPYIKMTNPMIINDISKNAASAMEHPFTIEKLDFPADGYLGLEDLIKYIKFGKDFLGMNEKVNDMKERVVTTEVEDGESNTQLMAEPAMRNFAKFSRDMKTKFGLTVKVKKTMDDMEKPENSEQAFTKGLNDEEI